MNQDTFNFTREIKVGSDKDFKKISNRVSGNLTKERSQQIKKASDRLHGIGRFSFAAK
ncbi:hypothetical protein DLJ48_08660 [Oenococcus sicerae]|uniref:Uncharacterized protein n=1 Tax=Oenococcus sicerae TaxID=2203724 RepID=A0ABX6J1T8_9LACO|nr:hypothetical protein [Oenococcus sicerae]QHW12508.1 hypothetical protein DLJ48_08660 [Oenococcus sicerae]